MDFSQWLIINEVFRLDLGRVFTLSDIFETTAIQPYGKATAQTRIATIPFTYQPGPKNATDHIVAAVTGLKPTAIIRYDHHPESPAAAIVSDELKKSLGHEGEIQAELLKHGFKVRPDFRIIHMNLPGYSKVNPNIIIGGHKDAEELWDLMKCQHFLDLLSSPDHDVVTPEIMQQVDRMVSGNCRVFCKIGDAGINCKPIHRRIGQLLGYTNAQVDEFLSGLASGYDHLPDVKYPVSVPDSLSHVPRKKLF